MNKKQLKSLIRRFDAMQVDQIWMSLSAFNFNETEVLILKPMGTGVKARKFTWMQLLGGRVVSDFELLLQDGTRMTFFKLQPIHLRNAG